MKKYLESLGITWLEWPPYSLDLNPIENLWALLKAEVNKRFPELTKDGFTKVGEWKLFTALQQVWNSMGQEIINNLIESMKDRIAAVIAAKGWYTKY